jgi:hypothetical protein
MKRFSFTLLFSALGALYLLAQSSTPVGTVIKGFTLPQRSEKGDPIANISGDQARVVTLNRTEITNLRVELFDDGKPSTFITSSQCDLWRQENRLTTKSGVEIKREGMILEAGSMDWLYKERRGVMRNGVKVVLNNFQLGAKPGTVAPAEPAGSLLLQPIPPGN